MSEDDMERRLLYNNYAVSETRGNQFKFIPWQVALERGTGFTFCKERCSFL